MRFAAALVAAALLLGVLAPAAADEYSHRCGTAPLLSEESRADSLQSYAIGDAVRLWVNKVGPYNNPQARRTWETSANPALTESAASPPDELPRRRRKPTTTTSW